MKTHPYWILSVARFLGQNLWPNFMCIFLRIHCNILWRMHYYCPCYTIIRPNSVTFSKTLSIASCLSQTWLSLLLNENNALSYSGILHHTFSIPTRFIVTWDFKSSAVLCQWSWSFLCSLDLPVKVVLEQSSPGLSITWTISAPQMHYIVRQKSHLEQYH